MEYAEDDEPEQIVEEEVLEASAQIPNIPVPRSSDGNVRSLASFQGNYPEYGRMRVVLLTASFSTGSFVYPISSRSTLNHSTQTHISVLSKRTNSSTQESRRVRRTCQSNSGLKIPSGGDG